MSFTLTVPALEKSDLEKSDPFLVKGHGFPLPGEGGGHPALLGSAWKGKEQGAELLSPVVRSVERYEQPEGKETLRETRKLLGSGRAKLTKFFPMHMPNT